jgi:hypothetical protein
VTRFALPETMPAILGWHVPEWQTHLDGSYLKDPSA